MYFTELSLSEFKKAKFATNNFLQAPEMYQRYQDLGRESYLVGLKDSHDQILAAGLILGRPWHFGRKCFRVAGGWLMDYDAEDHFAILQALTKGAREFCRQKRAIVLTVMPRLIREITDQQDQFPAEPPFTQPVSTSPQQARLRSSSPTSTSNIQFSARRYTAIRSEFEQLGYKYLGEFEQLKWHYRLYLRDRQPAELFASFREGHRRQIRKAEKLDIRLRELGGGDSQNLSTEDAHLFKSIVAETGERQHFQDPPAEYYTSIKRRFGDRVKLMLAEIPASKLPEQDRLAPQPVSPTAQATTPSTPQPTAQPSVQPSPQSSDGYIPTTAAMFLYDNHELSYLYGGSLRQYQKYGGAHLLQWTMIQEALQKGYDHYNFYGVKPFPDNGVYIFKQGFRGHVEELVGTFALPIGLLGKLYLSRIKPLKFREVN